LWQGVADELKGKVSVVKIDTDKYPSIASRYGVKVWRPPACIHLSCKQYCPGWSSGRVTVQRSAGNLSRDLWLLFNIRVSFYIAMLRLHCTSS
jgi:hypothetical protein